MAKAKITDPVEQVIARALAYKGIEFVHDSQENTRNLDFYLPVHDVYIECKRFHSQRLNEQMSRANNVIAIQGMKAAVLFAKMLEEKTNE